MSAKPHWLHRIACPVLSLELLVKNWRHCGHVSNTNRDAFVLGRTFTSSVGHFLAEERPHRQSQIGRRNKQPPEAQRQRAIELWGRHGSKHGKNGQNSTKLTRPLVPCSQFRFLRSLDQPLLHVCFAILDFMIWYHAKCYGRRFAEISVPKGFAVLSPEYAACPSYHMGGTWPNNFGRFQVGDCNFLTLRGAHRALCPRCARAVQKVGCFSPPVATGPRVLNSAPYSPCWYTRDFLFQSDACHRSGS